MSRETLAELRDRAGQHSSADVRAPALLRIARVMRVYDQAEALRLLEAGLRAATSETSGIDRQWQLGHARMIAAAVAPERLATMPQRDDPGVCFFNADALGRIMIEHGHEQAAASYALGFGVASSSGEFPMGLVAQLLGLPSIDPAIRTALLRRAAKDWRLQTVFPYIHRFAAVFASHWQLLPEGEARSIAHEIADRARRQPQPRMNFSASYDSETRVKITNPNENQLFLILGALRALDPALAESLTREFDQLGAAAQQFPNGLESVHQELIQEQHRQPQGVAGWIMSGSPSDFAYLHSLAAADRSGEFAEPFRHALEIHEQDALSTRPNRAPKAFWPSTGAFRAVLYRVGKRNGPEAAAVYLDRVPDEVLRLFAAIEVEASLAGLPEFTGEVQIERHGP